QLQDFSPDFRIRNDGAPIRCAGDGIVVATESYRRTILFHGAEPGLIDELVEALCRRGWCLCRWIEVGFDFRSGQQIFEADARRLGRLADRSDDQWRRAGGSRIDGHGVAPLQSSRLMISGRGRNGSRGPAEHGELW